MSSTSSHVGDEAVNRAQKWNRFAAEFAPLQVDAAWTAELQDNNVDVEKQERMLSIRFYLKAIYQVALIAYNFGKKKWKFVKFSLPAAHFEDWLSLKQTERTIVFRELRFCHEKGVGDEVAAPDAENEFVMMCDNLSIGVIGQLDNIFIARHGIQVPIATMSIGEASTDQALAYLNTRIVLDRELYEKTKGDPAEDKKLLSGIKQMISDAVAMRKDVEKKARDEVEKIKSVDTQHVAEMPNLVAAETATDK
jgi:hypothetical protein